MGTNENNINRKAMAPLPLFAAAVGAVVLDVYGTIMKNDRFSPFRE